MMSQVSVSKVQAATCPNGICEAGETCQNCLADCSYGCSTCIPCTCRIQTGGPFAASETGVPETLAGSNQDLITSNNQSMVLGTSTKRNLETIKPWTLEYFISISQSFVSKVQRTIHDIFR